MIFYVCFYIIALFWLLWAMGESPSSVTRKSSSSVTRTRFLNCDAVPRLWREVGFCVAGVALCAIDGLLVWRVLGLVTSTLRFCGFPKAGLPSCSAPFSRGSASVLLSPPGGPFCPLSCPSPSKRTFLARLLFICLAVLLALSGCPFWRIRAAERPKRTHQRESKEHSQADQVGEVRFGGFGLLSGQNGPPGRERDRDPRPALVWWGYRACGRTGTWTLSSHPTPTPPPHPPTHPKTRWCRRWGENGVADEGKSGGFWCHRWGDLVSQMRGLPAMGVILVTPHKDRTVKPYNS